MTTLKDVPEEVFDILFKYLTLKDLQRLRKVCPFTKSIAEKYMRVHVKKDDEKEVELNFENEGDVTETLSSYLDIVQDQTRLKLPSSRYCINFKTDKVFERSRVRRFLKTCGSTITHLRFKQLNVPMGNPAMINFFEKLPKLAHLTVDNLSERRITTSKRKSKRPKLDQNLRVYAPGSLKMLKTLCISGCTKPCTPHELFFANNVINYVDFNYVWQFVKECSSKLELFACPRSWAPGGIGGDLIHHQQGLLCILDILEDRALNFPNERNLKIIDFTELREPPWGDSNEHLCDLITMCLNKKVKLHNVQATYLEQMMYLGTRDMKEYEDEISSTVVSLIGLKESIVLMELSALERIVINTEHRETLQLPCWNFNRPRWPNLKELVLRIVESPNPLYSAAMHTRMLEFFFDGIMRKKLESLKISFLRRKPVCNYPDPGYILRKNLVQSCPHLKMLSISGWIGDEKDFEKLWDGLPLLEVVRVKCCRNLTDECFVTYKRKLTRPRLKNLKELKLEALEKMPGITDFLLKMVIRHKPLRELRLQSNQPINGITVKGIEVLLTGTFADTIEKFHLVNNLILQDTTVEELMEVESQFRSSQLYV